MSAPQCTRDPPQLRHTIGEGLPSGAGGKRPSVLHLIRVLLQQGLEARMGVEGCLVRARGIRLPANRVLPEYATHAEFDPDSEPSTNADPYLWAGTEPLPLLRPD